MTMNAITTLAKHPAWILAALLIATPAAQAERFSMEGAIVNSIDAKTVGTTRSEGEINDLFVAQKKMVVDILNDLGTPFDSLPKEIRDSISRFHTRNFEAFRAFSSGLNALDAGRYAEAKAFFQKAKELDPNFQLAGELEVSMPQTNIETGLQLQAALREAAKSATSSGKTRVEVDASRAVAALLSGQSVVLGASSNSSTDNNPITNTTGSDYTSNEPGSASQFAGRTVVGVTYSLGADTSSPVQVSSTNEWTVDQVGLSNNILQSVGDSTEFLATKDGASAAAVGSQLLGDNSTVYWGSWSSAPGASAKVTVGGTTTTSPQLGSEFHYMIGQATREMPTSGSATFLPAGGFMSGVSGNIGVNFVTRDVQLNDLGFTLGGLQFSQLNGATTYSSTIGSGFFKGNYTSGLCPACPAFSPTASTFTGNFLGAGADGLMLSNILQTGTSTVGGVHLFTK